MACSLDIRVGLCDDSQMLLGGVPPEELLRSQRPRLVELILERLVERIAFYGEFPTDVIDVDVRAVVHENLRLFESGLRGSSLDDEALGRIAASAYRRAEEGIPLELVQHAYMAGVSATWSEVTSMATGDDVEVVRELARRVFTHLDDVFGVLSASYMEEWRAGQGQEQSARASLLEALLSGDEGALAAADGAGSSLAPTYLIVQVGLPDLPLGEPSEASALVRVVAERRRRRVAQGLFAGVARHEPLTRFRPDGILLLLPRGDASGRSWSDADAESLVEGLGESLQTRVRAAAVESAPEGVREGAGVAADLLDLITRMDQPAGLHHLRDHLVPFQLSRPGPAAEALRARLAPLMERSDLLETLRVHIAEELSRTRTAARLSVHPNSVDYRLGRVRELTGLDPGRPSDLAVLRAALLAELAAPAHSSGGADGPRPTERTPTA